MFASWKLSAGLGLALLIALGVAYHFHTRAVAADYRAQVAEEALARTQAVLKAAQENTRVLNDAIAAKDKAKVKIEKQIQIIEKEIHNDPQASDPAPRVIRRALGRLPE